MVDEGPKAQIDAVVGQAFDRVPNLVAQLLEPIDDVVGKGAIHATMTIGGVCTIFAPLAEAGAFGDRYTSMATALAIAVSVIGAFLLVSGAVLRVVDNARIRRHSLDTSSSVWDGVTPLAQEALQSAVTIHKTAMSRAPERPAPPDEPGQA